VCLSPLSLVPYPSSFVWVGGCTVESRGRPRSAFDRSVRPRRSLPTALAQPLGPKAVKRDLGLCVGSGSGGGGAWQLW